MNRRKPSAPPKPSDEPKTLTPSEKLTREQIERLRGELSRVHRYSSYNLRAEVKDDINALCDMALRSLSPPFCENPDEWLRGHEKRLRELELKGRQP